MHPRLAFSAARRQPRQGAAWTRPREARAVPRARPQRVRPRHCVCFHGRASLHPRSACRPERRRGRLSSGDAPGQNRRARFRAAPCATADRRVRSGRRCVVAPVNCGQGRRAAKPAPAQSEPACRTGQPGFVGQAATSAARSQPLRPDDRHLHAPSPERRRRGRCRRRSLRRPERGQQAVWTAELQFRRDHAAPLPRASCVARGSRHPVRGPVLPVAPPQRVLLARRGVAPHLRRGFGSGVGSRLHRPFRQSVQACEARPRRRSRADLD